MSDSPNAPGVPTIAGYSNLVLVGHGGFSHVYRVTQDTFHRRVAIKILSVAIVGADEQRRFRREAEIMGELSHHPNIVTVLDSGFTDEGKPFMVMDYFERGSIAQMIERSGPLPVPDVLRIGVKLAGALATAHQLGIVHKDIKPANVLVSGFGDPALADFGIAVRADSNTTFTAGAITAAHAAPESLNGEAATTATDVYSLGSTLFSMLAGHNAFEGSLLSVMRQVLDTPPPRISTSAPVHLIELVRSMMAKDPLARPRSAAIVGQQLQEVERLNGLAVTALPVDDGEPVGALDARLAADPSQATPDEPALDVLASASQSGRLRQTRPDRPVTEDDATRVRVSTTEAGDDAHGSKRNHSQTRRISLVVVATVAILAIAALGVVVVARNSEGTTPRQTTPASTTVVGPTIAAGSSPRQTTPAPTTIPTSTINTAPQPALSATAITAGLYFSCALAKTGTVTCWGNNSFGQLGDGTTTSSSTPRPVTGLTDITDITASGFGPVAYSCALAKTGTVTCWGNNLDGELGDGTRNNSTTPRPVTGLTDITAITAGGRHSCALAKTGTVTCWGRLSRVPWNFGGGPV